ncbi:MAG: hypothetical protein II965_06510 [Pyramidobacter sp.]|nr:hypothetical protein [Pyramidobacter sp.]
MVEVQKKYGCLTVLDSGQEYMSTEKYKELHKEKNAIVEKLKEYRFVYGEKVSLPRLEAINAELQTHYKCRCKCGKTFYYNEETIESKPKYCFRPIYLSQRCTYSSRAHRATQRKKQKYDGLECVKLCDKIECVPSEEYCGYYNADKIKQLQEQEKKRKEEIASIPRVFADHFDEDYTGRQYESLYIEACCNEHLESEPSFYYSQFNRKHWNAIMVYKQYKCKCILCGKEQLITCDKFEINPPTKYGYHAYHGYWSEAKCNCGNRTISSLHWLTCKILFEEDVNYLVEYSFPDLYGIGRINRLRFDFAVFDSNGLLKCLIECQGEQHFFPVDQYGGKRGFDIQVQNDNLKRNYCKGNNIQLLEISYLDKTYERIKEVLHENGLI